MLYRCIVEVVDSHLAVLCIVTFWPRLSLMFPASLLLFLRFAFPLRRCPRGCSCHPLPLCACSLPTPVSPLCSFPLLLVLFLLLSVAFSSTVAFQKSPNVWDQASALRAFFVTFSSYGRDSFAVARSARAWRWLCCLHLADGCCLPEVLYVYACRRNFIVCLSCFASSCRCCSGPAATATFTWSRYLLRCVQARTPSVRSCLQTC